MSLSFLVLVLLRVRLLIPLFLGVLFLVPNVAPFFIFLLPNAIFISIYRCLVAIRPPPLLSLSGPSNHFVGRFSGRQPFRRSASLFRNFGYSKRLSHVDIWPPGLFCHSSHSGATILGRRNFGRNLAHLAVVRPLLFLATSAIDFDHRLAATMIDVALRPLASVHSDCLRSFWPLSSHCGHSSTTPVTRSIVDDIRLFSSPSSPALFPYSITAFVCFHFRHHSFSYICIAASHSSTLSSIL